MLKPFRNIRRKHLAKSRFGKYLLYAFGEIVLVVIGILIALSINNWNEQRKANKLEAEYYCRLSEDIHQDLLQVETLRTQADGRLKAANRALRLLQNDKPNKIQVATQIGLAIKAIYIDFKPNDSAFEDLKSGANLKVIRDKDVIKALNDYYNKMESLKSIIQINGQNAVDISFAELDGFETGQTAASILNGLLQNGLEPDVREAIALDTAAVLTEPVRLRLFNEALRYVSANIRQLELYTELKKSTVNLTKMLQQKCAVNND